MKTSVIVLSRARGIFPASEWRVGERNKPSSLAIMPIISLNSHFPGKLQKHHRRFWVSPIVTCPPRGRDTRKTEKSLCSARTSLMTCNIAMENLICNASMANAGNKHASGVFRGGSEAINTRKVFYRNRSMTQQSKHSKLLHSSNLSTGLCNPNDTMLLWRMFPSTSALRLLWNSQREIRSFLKWSSWNIRKMRKLRSVDLISLLEKQWYAWKNKEISSSTWMRMLARRICFDCSWETENKID